MTMERSRPRVGGYDAVVLGSAIHNQDWLAGSTDFVQRNLGTLAGRPVWLFSVGMLGDQGSAFAPPLSHLFRAMRARSKERPTFLRLGEAIHARGHRYSAGAVERSHLPWVGRVVFRAMGGRYGDHRDWQLIDAWAQGIASQLTG